MCASCFPKFWFPKFFTITEEICPQIDYGHFSNLESASKSTHHSVKAGLEVLRKIGNCFPSTKQLSLQNYSQKRKQIKNRYFKQTGFHRFFFSQRMHQCRVHLYVTESYFSPCKSFSGCQSMIQIS